MMTINEKAEQKVNNYLEHYGVKGMKWGKHLKRQDYTVADYIKEHPEYADVLKMLNPNQKITKDFSPKIREITTMASTKNEKTTKEKVFPGVTDILDKAHADLWKEAHPEESKSLKTITGETGYTKSELDKLESDIKSGKSSGELESVYLRKMNLYLKDDSVSDELKEFMHSKLNDGKWWTTDVDYKSRTITCKRVDEEGNVEDKEFKFPKGVTHSILAQEKVGSYLEHHGILGMSWGVRNGPPYPLSKKVSSSIKKSRKVKVDIRNLDDEDLKKIVQRLNLEKQLKELTKEDTKKAESFLSKTLTKLRDKTADSVINMLTKSIESAGTKKLTSFLNEKLNKESVS